MRSIVADCVGLFFLDKRRNRNIVGELKIPLIMIMQ